MIQRNYKEKNVQEMNMEDLINTVSDDLKRYDKLKTLEGVKKEMSVGLFSNNLSERGLKAYIRLLELELQLATTREPIFHDSRGFGDYLAGKYAELDHEEMHLISLSNKGQIISDDIVGSGTVEKWLFWYDHKPGETAPFHRDDKFDRQHFELLKKYCYKHRRFTSIDEDIPDDCYMSFFF